MIAKNYIKMCEQAEEIQKAWKKKKSHIEDKIYIKESDEFLLITKEFEHEYDGETEYFIFQRAKNPPEPLPFTKWSKETFYKYDDGELNIIYLPTQEQLQGMVLTKNILENTWSLGWLINNVYYFMENKYEYAELPEYYAFKNFIEVNELWLAFVMYKKYKKTWTSEKWVKAE